ncbi:MAG: hypothetical protein EXR72_01525 [Myxococcales bacterium]|nr:hypothetical protein [Myxococcales bacterium]
MRHAAHRLLARLARPLIAAHRRKVNRQGGFALVVVTVTVAVLAAVVGEFGYNSRVEMESAANARDQLRAEYLARSGINLSRLLIKTQQAVIDKINNQFKMDIQIGDFAPFLMKAFGGADGAEALGDLLGIGAGSVKGLGVGKSASFDVAMTPEDGKININCAGGLNAAGNGVIPQGNPQPVAIRRPGDAPTATPINDPKEGLFRMLVALMYPRRYDRIFDNPDADGQYATREEVARAIIDWSDVDETRYDPATPSGGGGEDYHYDSLRDTYKAHNNFFDTVEELQLVKGVSDDFWGSFGEMFTVYGTCQINLNAVSVEHWPITAAIVRASAKDQQNPSLLDETLVAALAQQVRAITQATGGLKSTDDLAKFAANKGMPLTPPGAAGGTTGGTGGAEAPLEFPPIPGLTAIELDNKNLNTLARIGPREIYRIDSTGTIQRSAGRKIQVHIRAVFDTTHFNGNATSGDPGDTRGTWVYWRMD